MSSDQDLPDCFWVEKDNIYLVPILHYKMEFALCTRNAFLQLSPDCVAVELPEEMELQFLHAASRLPDLSVILDDSRKAAPVVYMCEPCDPCFEALRSALESGIACKCIDISIDNYPSLAESIPDAYAVTRIGFKEYYNIVSQITQKTPSPPQDHNREIAMAKRLKELSLRYDRVLFVGGMAHICRIVQLLNSPSFPEVPFQKREEALVATLSEKTARDVMAEMGWMTLAYESWREGGAPLPDRQALIFSLYKTAGLSYSSNEMLHSFPSQSLRNLMKFSRNYAIISGQLMPNLFQILSSAKACVDHNYGYYTWDLATEYPLRRNVDGLSELDLTVEQVWGHSKLIRFHMRLPVRKEGYYNRKEKSTKQYRFETGIFGICSYPKEDGIIEKFGDYLKKRGRQILLEESSRTIPFSTSLEEGIDTRETIRHWHEKRIFVRVKGKPPAPAGSIVVIFDEDVDEEGLSSEKYPWKLTWIGEHTQESDMAFYASPLGENLIGPGICRCEYGGIMMTSPPRRLRDVWTDPDYSECRTKAEVLLSAAIDYSTQPLIVYVAAKPPRSKTKSFAKRYGRKIVYLPLGQLSPTLVQRLRTFHVLDGHDKRRIADEYIF